MLTASSSEILRQFIHCLLHALNAERKVTQPTGLRAAHTLRRIFLSENLQLRVFIDTKIQFPVLTLRAVVFPDDNKAQLVHIELPCGFVVGYDDRDVVYF